MNLEQPVELAQGEPSGGNEEVKETVRHHIQPRGWLEHLAEMSEDKFQLIEQTQLLIIDNTSTTPRIG